MQHYRYTPYPIEEICRQTTAIAEQAQKEAVAGNFREACKIIKRAEAIEIMPKRANNFYLMRRDWEEEINLRS